MSSPNRPAAARAIALVVVLPCLAASLGGCSLGGGSSKSGGPPADAGSPAGTITLRFATAEPGAVGSTFAASSACCRAAACVWSPCATTIARPTWIRRSRVTLPPGGSTLPTSPRARGSRLGATGLRGFQSPFLITSDALLDRVVADPRIGDSLLRSLAPLRVTGLALTPRDVRYLFATRPLDRPDAFKGARIRINESPTTDNILATLGARPTADVSSGPDVAAALREGRLDGVEASMRLAVASGYVRSAPHVSAPLFAKVTTLVANSSRLRQLGPSAAGWIREAAKRAAAAERALDDRGSWLRACGAGMTVAHTTPARLDALHAALADTHANLDADRTAALAIDRIGLLATQSPRVDPWAHCGSDGADESATKVIDGAYEVTITDADLAATGELPDVGGRFRFRIDHGRYIVIQPDASPDPSGPTGTTPVTRSRSVACSCTATGRSSGPRPRRPSRGSSASSFSATACAGSTSAARTSSSGTGARGARSTEISRVTPAAAGARPVRACRCGAGCRSAPLRRAPRRAPAAGDAAAARIGTAGTVVAPLEHERTAAAVRRKRDLRARRVLERVRDRLRRAVPGGGHHVRRHGRVTAQAKIGGRAGAPGDPSERVLEPTLGQQPLDVPADRGRQRGARVRQLLRRRR